MTLTLDPAIRHTVVHHSSTSTYIPNFIEIKETFCGRMDIFPPLILLGRLLEVDLIIGVSTTKVHLQVVYHIQILNEPKNNVKYILFEV